jgi:tyrosyl-tRNA synthetase
VDSGLATSKSQARRLIEQNGVKIDGKAVGDPYLQVNPDAIIQVGKRHFIRIIN